jgi:O-antigen/teichoic acid export membrane protein
MTRSAQFLRNVASNWIGFAVNAGVTLLLTPFVLHHLGETRYGVWIFTSSIIGYYGLLDFGLRGTVNQYMTRYIAVRDFESASEYMSTAVAMLSSIGTLCLAFSVAAAWIAPQVWSFPPALRQEAFWCILVVGVTASLEFVFFPFMAIFTAMQRFDLANLIGVGTRLLTASGIYAALEMGYGLVGISLAGCGGALLDYLIRWRVACRLAPELEISLWRARSARLREMASFAAWTFLMSVNTCIYLYLQPLLIGALLPIAAVGYYALATGLSRQIDAALKPIGHVIYPAAAELHANGDHAALERLYHAGSRLMLLAMVSAVLVAATWAEDFYRLWIGDRYLDGSEYPSVALLLRVLLIATAVSFVSGAGSQILLGAGRVRLLAKLLICGSALNLTLSAILIHAFGLIGAAVATAAAALVIDTVAIPLALQRVLGLRVSDFVRLACVRPAVAAALLAVLMTGIRYASQPAGWLDLIGQISLAGAVTLAVVATLGITPEERERYVVQAVTRLLRKRRQSVEALMR